MTFYHPLLVIICFITSCTVKQPSKDSTTIDFPVCEKINTEPIKPKETKKTLKYHDLSEYGLVDILSVDSSIQVDLKYATNDNFMKHQLYFNIERAYLQKDVAERLTKAQTLLKSLHPKYSLLVYDAARPVEVQQRMWDALDSIPVNKRIRFVSNPKNHSLHNYGAAVDLTIIDEQGNPLDMGAGYDDIREIAYPRLEKEFLDKGELTAKQIENRMLLRKVMSHGGFTVLPTEWWHFNACDRATAKAKYSVFLKEPKEGE